jgi:mono/diheme cytochrome c family protein
MRIVLLVVVGFGVIQLVPYGHDHDNPPTVQEPDWDSDRTRQLALGACFDCHSNLTSWPWYTSVAPFSWLVQNDVEEGRSVLNFSEWQRPQEVDVREVVDVLREGEMPPLQYRLLHEQARLSDQEKDELALGLSRTWDRSPPGS